MPELQLAMHFKKVTLQQIFKKPLISGKQPVFKRSWRF